MFIKLLIHLNQFKISHCDNPSVSEQNSSPRLMKETKPEGLYHPRKTGKQMFPYKLLPNHFAMGLINK